MEHLQNELCKEKFKFIENQLEKGTNKMDELSDCIKDTQISLAKTATSLAGVSKALWAIVGIVASALVGFLFWYIQQ